ncbi:uncharacterized protein LOC118882575 isoform X4 [Balaenoptera musculus]|uniref:Uncharacterized protein LOC118882575 isoform X4 n=1 Tax=Balaenoptera musculus TaxID=9771 RepID=A0A8B8VHZ4_BALMU|nr:uncharacterized protein LOC118882575 isoform X4 [Balaenoptera musculus]
MGLPHALGWWRRAAGEGDGECGRVREYPPVPVWASVPTEGESGRPAGQSGCVPFLRRRGDGDQTAEEVPPSSFRRGGERRHLPTRWSAWTLDISSKKVTVARKTSRSNRVTPNHLETLPDISSKKVTVGRRGTKPGREPESRAFGDGGDHWTQRRRGVSSANSWLKRWAWDQP